MRRSGVRLFYLTATAVAEQLMFAHMPALQPRCYHHIEMRPLTVGRVLGIGLRVAGRVAGQRLGAAAVSSPAGSGVPRSNSATPRSAGSLKSGLSGLFKPFRRVGGILWLEVTGVFFLLPVLVFSPTVWRTRQSFAHGPDHRTFLASAVVVVIFFYLGVSSFWRAHRRSRSQAGPASK
jgi:hypothetical protein